MAGGSGWRFPALYRQSESQLRTARQDGAFVLDVFGCGGKFSVDADVISNFDNHQVPALDNCSMVCSLRQNFLLAIKIRFSNGDRFIKRFRSPSDTAGRYLPARIVWTIDQGFLVRLRELTGCQRIPLDWGGSCHGLGRCVMTAGLASGSPDLERMRLNRPLPWRSRGLLAPNSASCRIGISPQIL